jgi:plastocyanin
MGRPGFGATAGRSAGGFLGNGLSRILGFGDYSVKSNSIFQESMAIAPGESVPAFGMIGQETRVRHREYIQDIVVPSTPTAFTNTAFTINAGDAVTFPWLAALASNYQQYKVNGMVFEYKTLSSDITAGGALGAVVLATNYDVTETEFTDKLHMENSQYAISAKPSQSQIHTIECDQNLTQSKLLYVRDGNSRVSGVDARLSDLGKFQVATVGLPGSAGVVLGELWVSYDVSLYKPEIAPVALGTSGNGSKTGQKDNLFNVDATINGNVLTLNTNTVTFTGIGQYLFEIHFNGTGVAAPVVTGTATVVALTGDSLVNSAGTLGVFLYLVTTTVPSQTMILDATGSTTVSVAIVRAASYTAALG